MTTGTPSKLVVVGATSAIAEHTLRLWLGSGARSAVLVGRDEHRLEALATDLRVRFPAATLTVAAVNLSDPAAISSVVTDSLDGGAPDTVLIAHGTMTTQEEASADLTVARDVLVVTGVSVALWLEAYANALSSGTIGVIGSVAGDRGRKTNYVYGAAKGLIERYSQGLQHRLAGSRLKIVLIKPGPTETPMTARLAQSGVRLAPVESVARDVVAALSSGRPVVYTPAQWRIIMMIVRLLPAPIFNRLSL
ncbi:SDR family NAD(P)-dependent oxidoreductase [Rathayibacter toxicus]|uniref:Short-chain dehydrogenase n=1 Tax=Rathayibacter toxicus TaxID=145458 RepID=A0A0C5BCI5_9MICO|nr:SDR family NAD(P)-dependent oxidoreductase [Rathayibacter toxicus]AJM76886.1 short-chain dehydrogenase [Rathayibacter toxicus]ALS57345.1 short-chain dehydrogenase [Rathayibacter toxicus]KKM45689.1 short-chain dehydrogenase [Rathayibacter toxicus]PPG24777.1 KR domain-containing protein [Rathayibacter toxicus]PPG48232.1 KR domain-containing protein [Rathayibacter toxicus]